MITKEKVERYMRFNGDLDKWIGSQKVEKDLSLNGMEWELIDKLIQRLRLEKHGTASREFMGETQRLLAKSVENEEAIKVMKTMN